MQWKLKFPPKIQMWHIYNVQPVNSGHNYVHLYVSQNFPFPLIDSHIKADKKILRYTWSGLSATRITFVSLRLEVFRFQVSFSADVFVEYKMLSYCCVFYRTYFKYRIQIEFDMCGTNSISKIRHMFILYQNGAKYHIWDLQWFHLYWSRSLW